ncbi:hypothetical protein EXIGLDRAFT_765267 [Exidia glandulosa HHB12029]|uniref:Uncharacterized protein n=1 Tax=Exidia glandulosa HHB12029 TaxID=1314781 RepID=A0A165KK05_EXIGL|nr:hypothetical protein EXIGLDRAFT_765267 [Exidia glandulosa HHB12029]
MSTIHDLPVEMLDEVLMAIDDLAALEGAVLSYRRFYNIYKARQDVIRRRVLRNALGGDDVIAASLRMIYIEAVLRNYPPTHPTNPSWHVDHFLVDIKPLKEDKKNTPTASEYGICVERARICQQLEVLYSRSMKDRHTDTASRLSLEESDRFRAAVYRLWLLGMYPRSKVQSLCTDAATRVQLFYDGYTARDVYDLHCVLDWFKEIVGELLPVDDTLHHCLCAGPAQILEAYLEPDCLSYHVRSASRFQNQSGDAWKEDLLLVFKAHQLLSPAETTVGTQRAGRSLACGYGMRQTGAMARGFLDRNCYERRLSFQLIGATDARPRDNLGRRYLKIISAVDVVPEMTVGRVLQELCDLPALIQDEEYNLLLENDDFSGLTTNDLLCANCLQEMIKARLGLWWRYMKEKYAPQEHEKASCRYSFQCRLQPWKPRHAARCNHASPNTSCPERRIRRAEKRSEEAEKRNEEAEVAEMLREDDGMSGEGDETSAATTLPLPPTQSRLLGLFLRPPWWTPFNSSN